MKFLKPFEATDTPTPPKNFKTPPDPPANPQVLLNIRPLLPTLPLTKPTNMSAASISVIPAPTPVLSAEERLAAAQAIIAKAMADKEAAKAAAAAAKEAAIALKEAEKARRAEERAAAKAAREAEKAALPKRPVGRPRKNPITAPAVVVVDDKDSVTVSIDEAASTGSITPPSSPVAAPKAPDTMESLRAELAELRTQLTVLQTAYQREHAFLERARKLFATAPV